MTSETSTARSSPERGGGGDATPLQERATHDGEAVGEKARTVAKNVRDTAEDFAGRARDKARDEAGQGKEAVAGGLEDFAAAVRKASEELGSRDQSMASQVVREVAGGLEHASRTIHGKDIGELTRSVGRFARERPATFLAGAALAGLALGRFARSSGEHSETDYRPDLPTGLPDRTQTGARVPEAGPGEELPRPSSLNSPTVGDTTGGFHDR